MKELLLVCGLALTGQIMADAGGADLLLKKHYEVFGGLDGDEFYSETCEFYDHQVVINKIENNIKQPERVLKTLYSGRKLRSLARVAKKNDDRITVPWNICDSGSVVVTAYPAADSPLIIKELEDCGVGHSFTSGAASQKLRKIADRYCPQDP